MTISDYARYFHALIVRDEWAQRMHTGQFVAFVKELAMVANIVDGELITE